MPCYSSSDIHSSSDCGRGKKSLDFSTPTTKRLNQNSERINKDTRTPFDSPDIDCQGLDDSFPTPLERSLTTENELCEAVAKNHGIVADGICKSRKRMQDEVFGELSDDDDDLLTNVDPGIGQLCIYKFTVMRIIIIFMDFLSGHQYYTAVSHRKHFKEPYCI